MKEGSAISSVLYDMAGPRTLAKIRTGSIVAGIVVAILAALVIYRLYINGALAPDLWSVLLNKDLAQLLLGCLWYTLTAAAVSIVLSVVFGVLLAAMRLAESPILRGVVRVWVEIFRGLPLLVLIFFLFLGMPALGIDVPVFWALVIGISLYNSAVMSEIFRAGIRSLPKGQAEAAYSIGLRKSTTLRLVLLPQAVRNMLPALVSQVVTILKESSLRLLHRLCRAAPAGPGRGGIPRRGLRHPRLHRGRRHLPVGQHQPLPPRQAARKGPRRQSRQGLTGNSVPSNPRTPAPAAQETAVARPLP